LAIGSFAEAAVVSGVLEFGEELADLVGELFASAEVEGALSAGDTVGNAVVWAVAFVSACAVGGDDGAVTGEGLGVVVDELERGHFLGWRLEAVGWRKVVKRSGGGL